MHILYLSQVLPYPLDAGPKMRSYYVLEYLSQRHKVTLLTFVRDSDRPEYIAHMEEICHAVHTVPMRRSAARDARFLLKSVAARQPFLIVRDEVAAMTVKLRELLAAQPFDAVHADQLWMAQYALQAKEFSPDVRLILDQHNAVYLIPGRMADGEVNPLKKMILARESKVMARYEAETCPKFDRVVWVTREDYDAVSAITRGPMPPPVVIPICGDPTREPPVERKAGVKRVTFLGGLHWPPNAQGIVWFAKNVFPKIRARVPDAVLTVIGKNPPAELTGDGVQVTGYVEDLSPLLAETQAFVVPLHAGGGMRVKIIDAWRWGLPIVSTTIGAEGIAVQNGVDILIADTAADFADAVIRVLQSPELQQALAENGRRTVVQKYNWRTIYTQWDEVYRFEK